MKLPYICKTKASTQNPNPPETPKCDGEYAIFDEFMQQCYRLEEAEKTWEEAEKSCKSQGSTHLTSILSIPEQAFMINKVQTEMTWIGLSDKSVSIPQFIDINDMIQSGLCFLAPWIFQILRWVAHAGRLLGY